MNSLEPTLTNTMEAGEVLFSLIPEAIKSKLITRQAFLVGGFLRDYFLCAEPLSAEKTDFDFVIFNEISLEELVREISDASDSSFVELDAESQTYRVINENWQADFAAPKGKTITEDLQARDFTVNSIGFSLANLDIIDPMSGLQDLQNGILRANHKDNLKDDPLRMLRAYRFCAQLKTHKNFSRSFILCPETQKWIQEQKSLIHSVAPERISYEIWQTLSSLSCFEALQLFLESGLWEEIFPEFTELRKVPENDFHHLPLIEHTFELINQYENFVKPKLTPEYLRFIEENHMSRIPLEAIIKMGCLLHDIAKPATWIIVANKHTFHGHDAQGAEITDKIGKRLLWPKAVTQCLHNLVQYHLRPFHIAPLENEPTDKAERRFFRKLENSFYPLIALAWADLLSTRGPMISQEAIEMSEKRLLKLCENYQIFCKQEEQEPLLLKGALLEQAIQESGLPKTKLIKELLSELRELQLGKVISSPEEAYAWFIKKGRETIKG
ncbi:MAG: HDIG domain-containing protein [Candidatus Caenarcaniphilales bacterium]|nr:HDIG domain-containing protein [Candidatus Caenarcaniphilales bacterium]